MRQLIIILMLAPMIGWGQHQVHPLYLPPNMQDTIPVTIDVQYSQGDAITIRDCYLINGVPYYKAKGKWVRVRAYRWRISENWIKQSK